MTAVLHQTASRIQLLVPDDSTLDQIATWARGFRTGMLTLDDVHDSFTALEVSECVALPLRKRIVEAQQELDAIRFGMCESGQRAEIERIFRELEALMPDCHD